MNSRILKNTETVIENLDRFDIKYYDETLMQSNSFRNMEKEGSKILSTFPSLQRDIWGSLYKYQPTLKTMPDAELTINKEIMSLIHNNPEFHGMREYTKMDDLASAISCLQLNTNLQQIIKKVISENEALQKQLNEQQKKAEQKRAEQEALQQAIEQMQEQMQQNKDQQQDSQQQEEQNQQMQEKLNNLQKQMKSADKAANKAEENAGQMQQQIQQQIRQQVHQPKFNQQLTKAIANSFNQVKEETTQVNMLMGGNEVGKSSSQNPPGTLLQKLQVAEQLKTNKALKKTLELAGKMSLIAEKKQKNKTIDTVMKSEVSMGNNPERLLPSELMQYSNPATKQLFMKRFAEGETFQYSTKEKERIGKGPVIACIDISGSMSSNVDNNTKRSEWAKAVAFALWTIAKKQKRKFYCIEFNSSIQSEYLVTPENIIRLLQVRENGGTTFSTPLLRSFEIIKTEKYLKKADIIFITDGDDSISQNNLEVILRRKKESNTSIYSVQLDTCQSVALESFSNHVIRYDVNKSDFTKIFEI